ncbi:MAG TPA: type IV secretion system protein [Novosphingobium sp.]
MAACTQLTAEASLGAAPALRAVDCLSNELAGAAFGRLFGAQGALLPALTILLTLYIAVFALALLTGRSRLGVAALTPRALTLGLVLTFATSWVAWQGVVWNLAIGAPDQLAGILTGIKGSATQIFAGRLDMIFAAIAQTASNGAAPAAGAAQAANAAQAGGAFSPTGLMWLGALLLLLGTVGVLVTARIALAVLLALGPVFVVLALFSGTRGLAAGWLRGLVMTAIAPLFVVAGGSLTLELAVPVIADLRGTEGIDPRAAMALFVIAAVHAALMSMVMKVAGTMVSAWTVFGLAAPSESGRGGSSANGAAAIPVLAPLAAQPTPMLARGAALAPVIAAAAEAQAPTGGSAQTSTIRTTVTQAAALAPQPGLPPLPRARARGIGSRFAARAPASLKEMSR